MAERMRVFLVCEDERLKTAVILFVDNQSGMVVSGISDRLAGLAEHLEHTSPDVLVIEWNLPLVSLKNLAAEIKKIESPPEIIYLSNKPEMQAGAIASGVDYFVLAIKK